MCLDDPKEFDDPHVSDTLKANSNEIMDFNDPNLINDLQVYVAPRGISFVSMDNDNPKVFGDGSILKVFFFNTVAHRFETSFCTHFYFLLYDI